MTQVAITREETPDPSKAPAGAEGDANRVTIDSSKKQSDPKTQGGEQRPEWLAPKFKSVEEQAKAYTELEKKLGEQSKATPTAEEVRKTVEDAGLNMQALSKELGENNGKLTEETLKALEKKGITPQAVNTYIDGLKAQATQRRAGFAEIAGSEDNLKTLYEWVGTNIAPEEVSAFNKLVDAGNDDAAKLALHGFVARYSEAVGRDPSLINSGDTSANSGAVQPYASTAQVKAAMSDPRYKTDEAYRQEVYKRMEKTQLFGIRA